MAEIKLKIASVVIGSGEGGDSGVAPYYADLPDKPSINGETLSGDMTSEDLGLASSEQSVPAGGTTGQVLAKKSNADNDVQWVNQESGEQGTMDYADLENKPKINNVTLSGNKTTSQLGLQAELVSGTNIKTINNQSIVGSGNISIESGGTEVEANPTYAGTPETLNTIKIGSSVYTAPQGPAGPQGEQGIQGETGATGATGPANTLSIGTVTDGEQAAASITGNAPSQTLNLVLPKGEKGDTGNDAVNPFKGYFDSLSDLQTKYPTGETGDFANVYNSTADKTYRYVWDASLSTPAWSQALDSSSQPIEVTPSTSTFATGQSVIDTSIVNDLTTGGTENVLSAQQGVVLAGQVSQLEHKVDSLPSGKDYGFFTSSSLLPSSATEEGFAYVGATEPYAIWQFDGTSWSNSGVTVNAITANPNDVQDAVDDYLNEHPTVFGTFLNAAKRKLISLLEKVAFVDEHGQDYIDELNALLFISPIDHISAVYTQGETKIYDIYSLDKLKENLVVTAYFTDGSASVVTDFTLTGNLVAGMSTITVSIYDDISQRDVTDTFNVSVIGTTKLYIDGEECIALTGGWQVKGFNLTYGSPSATKESSYLYIRFGTSSSNAAARTFSTVNKIPLTGLNKVIIESEAWNESGRCNDTLYFTSSLNESTTQSGAFGNDHADHRSWIIAVPQDGTLVKDFKISNIPGSLEEAYVSINANAFTSGGQYSAGTYWKIKKVALTAE